MKPCAEPSDESFRYYLHDLGKLLVESGLKARAERNAGLGATDYDFRCGRAMAYYEILDLMLDQAKSFGIASSALGMKGFDPQRLLER